VRVLVTGGAGFIGSHVANALHARGDDVFAFDDLSRGVEANLDAGVPLFRGDVCDRGAVDRAFAEARPDTCVHLAAQVDVRKSVLDPAGDAAINVLGTINVLEAARTADAGVVLSSTGGAIYGECQEAATEESPRRPIAPYGAAKLAAEEYLATWNRLYGGGHVSLRYANVYGPRQDASGEAGVVAIFLDRLAKDSSLQIFGDGEQTRDFVYVGDVASATLSAINAPAGAYNVGTGRETSVLELARLCIEVTGIESALEFEAPRDGELKRSFLDPNRAAEVLGFEAQTSLRDGLVATWSWLANR